MKKDLISLSKFISLVLRHKPDLINLNMDENGWVDVEELLKKSSNHLGYKINKTDFDEMVATNDKKRFAYSEDGKMIRASQGHSIDIDLKLEPKDPPEFLYHGTSTRFLDSILKNGIKKMNRQHVHLSATIDTATKVGSRHGKPLVLIVKAQDMCKDNIKFFLSDNNVWLVDEVPAKYIEVKYN